MRENLSAKGNLEDWIDAAEEALWVAGFERVEIDEHFDRLAADIGKNDYLDINFLIQEDGRIRLEIDASNQNLIKSFKGAVSKIMQNGGPPKTIDQNAYTAPQDDDQRDAVSKNDYPENGTGKRGKRGRSGKHGFSLPQVHHSKNPFYSRTWFALMMLICVPPLGIFLMYYYKKFNTFPRILLTLLAIFYTLLIWLGLFGVNTGVNQESINKWLQNTQFQITRFINEHKPANTSPSPSALPTATPSPTAETKSNDTSDSPLPPTDTTDNPISDLFNALLPPQTSEEE